MINPLKETVIRPRVAVRDYPRDEHGRKVHISTIYRHMTIGVRGVVLESIKTPRLCTSREAIARFFLKLSERPERTLLQNQVLTQKCGERRVEEELDRLDI